jgi:YVTN family beta-propeller protein
VDVVQIDDKFRSLFFLSLLNIMVFLFLVVSTHEAFAQTLHDKTLYEIINQSSGLDAGPQIKTGKSPVDIAIKRIGSPYEINSPNEIMVYVANSDSNSVSVISGENNTKIKDIPVGEGPRHLAVNAKTENVYVANQLSDSVSVFSAKNNTKIGKDIPVGDFPTDIGIDGDTNTVYVANQLSDSVSVISGENNTKIKDIPVGEAPVSIMVSERSKKVYVANFGDDSVSVISSDYNRKIRDIPVGEGPSDIDIDESIYQRRSIIYVVNELSNSTSVIHGTISQMELRKNISVGERPVDIAYNFITHTAYVANGDSDSVSVFSAKNNTKIGKDIPVGDFPTDIGIDGDTNTVYVANHLSDSVSVISGENNTKIKDIPVVAPIAIDIDQSTNTVYVITKGYDGISVIDGITNKIVAGITLQVKPFNSGYIICDGITSPIEQYIYLYSGAKCIAKPNKGFEFLTWEENLNNNLTQLVTVSRSASPLDTIADLLGIKSDKPEATLNITKFGTFTANFKELPPPIPSEYWIPLYGIIASTIVGWSIPSIIGWTRSKGDIRKLNHYHQRIKLLYDDGKLDENDIDPLDKLKIDITDAYSKGKINELHYINLKKEISILYEEIFKKRIESLDKLSKEDKGKVSDSIKEDISDAYSKEKIIELHYSLLNKKIEEYDDHHI